MTGRRPGRPFSGGATPSRSMRIGLVYDNAKALAELSGRTITEVVTDALRKYLAEELRNRGLACENRQVSERRAEEPEMNATATPALPAPRSSRSAALAYRRLDKLVNDRYNTYSRARGRRRDTGKRIQSAAETRAHARYQDALLARANYYRAYDEMIEAGEGVLAREEAARNAR